MSKGILEQFPLRLRTVVFNVYLLILLAEFALSIWLYVDMTSQQRNKAINSPQTILGLTAATVFWTITVVIHPLFNSFLIELFNFFCGLALMPTWLTLAIFISVTTAQCSRSGYDGCSYMTALCVLAWVETPLVVVVGFWAPSFEVLWRAIYRSGSRSTLLLRRMRMHIKRRCQMVLDLFPRKFRCAICMENHRTYRAVRFFPCRHPCCADCARGYISSKLEEKSLPILCPICITEKARPAGKIGTLDDAVLRRVRMMEDMAAVMSEIEVSQNFSLVECPNCQRATYINKEDFHKSVVVICPSPGCKYLWCKTCSWASGEDTSEARLHSCEGAVELRNLINSKGWRYCPGCRTPTEKIAGCTHMKCNAPGCFTHFCYACGQAVLSNEFAKHTKTCARSTTYV